MKKNMKRFTSMLLTSAMVMGMGLTTFAAPTEETLTINGVAGHKYYVYQMLTGEVSELTNKGAGVLANVNAGSDLKDTNNDGDIDKVDAAAFEAAIKGLSGTELSNVAKGYIKSTAEGDEFYLAQGGTTYQVPVDSGYYVVIDRYTDSDTACAAYMVAVAGPTTMNPKTSTPDIDKNITDTDANQALETTGTSKKTDTAAIGDVISYESTSTVPVTEGYKYYYYVVSDTMSDGLTYNGDLAITINDVPLGDNEYTVTASEHGFKLVVNDMKQYTAGAPIVITYSATVNDNAKIGNEANTNTIKLTYSNNPEDTFDKEKNTNNEPGEGDVVGETPEHITKTYVTEVAIKKVDQDGNPLTGAEFTLEGTNLNKIIVSTSRDFVKVADEDAGKGKYYLLTDGTYTNEAPITDENAAGYNAGKYAELVPNYNVVTTVASTSTGTENKKVTATVDEKGMIVFTGLNAGDYTLKETVTPTGYTTAADISFKVIVAQNGTTSATEGTAIVWSDNTNAVVDANGVYEITVENVKGNLLPSTGGIGTTIFYVMGTILSLGAGVILVAKKRIAR